MLGSSPSCKVSWNPDCEAVPSYSATLSCFLSDLFRQPINKRCNRGGRARGGAGAAAPRLHTYALRDELGAEGRPETASRPVNALVVLQNYLAMQS